MHCTKNGLTKSETVLLFSKYNGKRLARTCVMLGPVILWLTYDVSETWFSLVDKFEGLLGNLSLVTNVLQFWCVLLQICT